MQPGRHAYFFIVLVTALFIFTSSVYANRAITVQIREQEKPDAPIAGDVTLYSESHALVIGIDNYTAGWPRLSGAVNDARLVADALEVNGFDVTIKTNLNSRELKQELDDFFIAKGANPDARLFVWFAGHGHTLNGEGYLIPADAPRPNQKVGFKRKALSMRRFGEYVRQAESKHAFAVFDSCFSGTIFSSQRSIPPSAVTRATTFPVRQFLSSGDADQTVSDNGLFRKLFIRALKGETTADANQDGYITGSELGMFLTDRMTNLTASVQTPRYGKLRDADYDRGDFVFIVPKTGKTPSAKVDPGLNLPDDTDVSFDDILNDSKKKEEQAEWKKWQDSRQTMFDKVQEIDKDPFLTKDQKTEAWARLLKAMKQDNPYSEKDDKMRNFAMGRIEYWKKIIPAKKKPPAKNTDKLWTDPITGIEFVWIPGGCFNMGSDNGDLNEQPVHKVCLEGFWMSKYEVTISAFQYYLKVSGSTTGVNFASPDCPILQDSEYSLKGNAFGTSKQQPMIEVSWHGAKAFAQWLTSKSQGTFRLPSEAQWEYAARAGKITRRSWGDDISCANALYENDQGTDEDSCTAYTHQKGLMPDSTAPVGSYPANPFGLHDMLGNVWEWCEDVYAKDSYAAHSLNNPVITSGGSGRVIRGGSWDFGPWAIRSASRGGGAPHESGNNLGFRLIRIP